MGRRTVEAVQPAAGQGDEGVARPLTGNNALAYTPFGDFVRELNAVLAQEAFPPKGDTVLRGRTAARVSTRVATWLSAHLDRVKHPGVIVYGDNDPPGADGRCVGAEGAEELARVLIQLDPARVANWALPDPRCKDLREHLARLGPRSLNLAREVRS